jgi:hypothetical protein
VKNAKTPRWKVLQWISIFFCFVTAFGMVVGWRGMWMISIPGMQGGHSIGLVFFFVGGVLAGGAYLAHEDEFLFWLKRPENLLSLLDYRQKLASVGATKDLGVLTVFALYAKRHQGYASDPRYSDFLKRLYEKNKNLAWKIEQKHGPFILCS